MTPHVLELGEGPSVLCLHANASTCGQWRGLAERLADRYRVVAVDTIGAGRSPHWPANSAGTLTEEVEFLAPVLERLEQPMHLVGHSYGGAIALMLALGAPRRVRSMALFEPTLFALRLAIDSQDAAIGAIRDVAAESARQVELGDLNAAARGFIDFWMGTGAWESTPQSRRPAIAHALRNIRHWGTALMHEPTPLEAFAALDLPVLYLLGSESPPAAHSVADLLVPTLPNVEVVELQGVGHMGPVTHPERVNDAIEAHLEAHSVGRTKARR